MSVLDSRFKRDFNELDKDKKNPAWADRIVSTLRLYMNPMVNQAEAAENRDYLYGRQTTERYSEKFRVSVKKKERKDIDGNKNKMDEIELDVPFKFKTLKLLEKSRNVITAELKKGGIQIGLKAEDPTATVDRDYDEKLIKNSNSIEQLLSDKQMSLGLPPYNLSQATDENGQGISKGNIQEFKSQGLDPNKPEDVSYFFKVFYRLKIEIAAETIVNHYVRKCKLEDHLGDWGDDMLAHKAIAGRVYADKVSNSPSFEYIRPEEMYWIKGRQKDGSDAAAMGCVRTMTVSDAIKRIGIDLDEENLKYFLEVINGSTTSYDGVYVMDGTNKVPYPYGCVNAMNFDEFNSVKIRLGYYEWKSNDCSCVKEGNNSHGQYRFIPIDYSVNVSERSNYKKERYFSQKTYCAYFIPMSDTGKQRIFNFGELYDMRREGDHDELSCFSFQVYKEDGPSAVDVAKTYIDNIHDAWYRLLWIINETKPKGTDYDIDNLAQTATTFFQDDAKNSNEPSHRNFIMELIDMFEHSPNRLHKSVTDLNTPNLQNPHFVVPNGVDAAAKDLLDIIAVNKAELKDELGLNDVRPAASPDPDVSFKSMSESLRSSQNTTYYIPDGILKLLQNAALNFVSIVQDKVRFKGTKDFNNLELAHGTSTIDTIKMLDKLPLYKLGIFVDSFNTAGERQLFMQELLIALRNKEIPYHTYMLIKGVRNPKKAAEILSYEKAKEIAKQEQQIVQSQKSASDLETLKHQFAMEQINAKGQWGAKEAELISQGHVAAAQVKANSDIDVKKFAAQVEPFKQDARVNARIKEAEAEEDLKKDGPVRIEDV